MARKSTMVELVQELEKVTPRTPAIEEMIQEARAGEYHDYKNKKYVCGKVEAYKKLQKAGLYTLAGQVRDGEFDEEADQEDREMLRKDIEENTRNPHEAEALKKMLNL